MGTTTITHTTGPGGPMTDDDLLTELASVLPLLTPDELRAAEMLVEEGQRRALVSEMPTDVLVSVWEALEGCGADSIAFDGAAGTVAFTTKGGERREAVADVFPPPVAARLRVADALG